MSQIKKSLLALLVCVLSLSSSVHAQAALNPTDALSARPDSLGYFTARIDDLNGLLNVLLDPSIIDALETSMTPQDIQNFRVFAGIARQIPARSVSWSTGVNGDKMPFAQAAFSVPSQWQAQLDRVAAGKAEATDFATLFLGDGGLLLAALIQNPAVQQGPEGPYYVIDGQLAIAARENLILVALSANDLQASLKALKDSKKRLDMPRKFKSPSYLTMHLDPRILSSMDIPANLSKDKDIEQLQASLKALKEFFKAPLRIEYAFDSKPDHFLISTHINVFEAFKDMDTLKKMKAVQGAGALLVGEGTPFALFSGVSLFETKYLRAYPELAALLDKANIELEKRGLTEQDLVNLLTGSISLALGNDAQIMGRPAKGFYLALNGQNGAASKFFSALLADEQFTKTITVAPVKAEGWDNLVMLDPSMVPATFLIGTQKDTFFLGLADPKTLSKQPALPEKANRFLKEKLFAMGYFDTLSLWNYIKKEAADNSSLIGSHLSGPISKTVMEILDAELSVTFIKAWVPALDTSFTEFSLVEVPQEKRLLGKLIKAGNDFKKQITTPSPEDEYPLVILLTVKETIEAYLKDNPKATIDEQQELVSDAVAFIESKDGTLYAGMQVSGDDARLKLIENAKAFELMGSSGLTIAPEATPYDGQEIVWIKINKPGK